MQKGLVGRIELDVVLGYQLCRFQSYGLKLSNDNQNSQRTDSRQKTDPSLLVFILLIGLSLPVSAQTIQFKFTPKKKIIQFQLYKVVNLC